MDKVVFVPAHPDPNKSHVTNWPDIVAVWAVRTSMGDSATDVVDMVSVTSAVTIETDDSSSPSSGSSSGSPQQTSSQLMVTSSSPSDQLSSQSQDTSSNESYQQKILTITISEKSYQDMITEYGFSSDQVETLNELMSDDNNEQMESIIDTIDS